MNTNEIRFYLHSYDKLKSEIQALSDSLKEYRLMDGIKAQAITGMPLTHGVTSKVEQTATEEYSYKGGSYERYDYVKQLEAEIDSKMRVLNATNSVYFYLKEPARTIIEMRYFITPMINDVRKPKYNWREIAAEIDKSEDYCKEIDCKVIRRIQNKLFETKGETK